GAGPGVPPVERRPPRGPRPAPLPRPPDRGDRDDAGRPAGHRRVPPPLRRARTSRGTRSRYPPADPRGGRPMTRPDLDRTIASWLRDEPTGGGGREEASVAAALHRIHGTSPRPLVVVAATHPSSVLFGGGA